MPFARICGAKVVSKRYAAAPPATICRLIFSGKLMPCPTHVMYAFMTECYRHTYGKQPGKEVSPIIKAFRAFLSARVLSSQGIHMTPRSLSRTDCRVQTTSPRVTRRAWLKASTKNRDFKGHLLEADENLSPHLLVLPTPCLILPVGHGILCCSSQINLLSLLETER